MLLKDRVALAMSKNPGLRPVDIARAVGISTASVAGWENGSTKSLKPRSARLAAKLFGCNATWLGEGIGDPDWISDPDQSRTPNNAKNGISLAQDLSHPGLTIAPQEIEWEAIVSEPLPLRFRLAVRDDAMQLDDPPSMRPGDHADFERSGNARPGEVVLLADGDGNVYIRRYLERRPGHWQAVARSPGYQALDSVTDRLKVLAVQVGGQWKR